MEDIINKIQRILFGTSPAQFSSPGSDRRSQANNPYPSPSFRKQRILNEIFMMAPTYTQWGGIYYDENNCDWIMFPQYPLPEKWEKRQCKFLLITPATYPDTPPIGFYLDRKILLRDGDEDPHFLGNAYHGAPDLARCGWHWYCVTIQNGRGGWRPSSDYRKPDNLLTFLNMARESLTNDF
jgi:hypothetical protein